MGKDRRWISQRRGDRYYRQAKSEGYKSRAAYKIKQIDEKHHVFKDDTHVLDLCCAPGAWSQYLLRRYPRMTVIGVDLNGVKISSPRHVFIQKNILDDDFIEKTCETMDKEPPFLWSVVSDCAPKFTGARELDLFRQFELSMRALDVCEALLLPGGNCVLKSFQGLPREQEDLMARVKSMFSSVHRTKPDSSRAASPEFYLVAKGKN